jgi:ligand-binding SRPBCC domain-containing protein
MPKELLTRRCVPHPTYHRLIMPSTDPHEQAVAISLTSGGRYRLWTETTLDRPIHEVFEFFADAGNLQLITPEWLHFRILTPLPIRMAAGTIIDYRLRLHGVPIGWRTRITEWNPPSGFVDDQLRGPYHQWTHRHYFETRGKSTWTADEVVYRPLGGACAHRLFVERQVRRIFAHRRRVMLELFGRAQGD